MRPLVLALALLFTTSVANADEQIRQPPTLRDAAKAHFRDGQAFFQSEQFGPAIVEFRAAWELSGERDLLHNLSWACEKAGRVIEAKDYASRYLAQSRGTEDEAMAERRVKFLSSRYPDAEAAPSTTALETKTTAEPEVSPPATGQAVTVATDSPKPSVNWSGELIPEIRTRSCLESPGAERPLPLPTSSSRCKNLPSSFRITRP